MTARQAVPDGTCDTSTGLIAATSQSWLTFPSHSTVTSELSAYKSRLLNTYRYSSICWTSATEQ